jgi:hypothetical protein
MIEYITEHLEIVIERSRNGQKFGHEQYRLLVDKSHPDHEIWRRRITEMATGEIQSEPSVISVQSEKTVISTGNGGIQAIPTQDAIQLNKEIRECPHYNKVSNCGCGRARCMAGKGGEIDKITNDGTSLVSFWDCSACLRPHMEIYTKNAYNKLS